ncbi:MAG: Ig-like domain-containing protein [Euryarchaeota archaeon]|nr:Ig-like domain-containing protein [Euryarchaeota archaeon]
MSKRSSKGTYAKILATVLIGGVLAGLGPLAAADVDTTAPVTTSSVSGTQHSSGWYTSNAVVTLSATDDISGVKATYYRWNGGNRIGYNPTTGLNVPAEGTTVITYWSEDNAGNAESTQTLTIRVDKIAPAVAVTSPEAVAADTAVAEPGVIHFAVSASDAPGSGIVQVKMYLDGVLVKVDNSASGPYFYDWNATTSGPGRHSFVARATDAVGRSAESSISVIVSVGTIG